MSALEQQGGRTERLRRAIEAKRAGGSRGSELPRRPADEPALLGDLQRGLWFVHQLDPQSPAYNLCSAFRVHGPLDVGQLQQAVDGVVSRHRLLRSTFRTGADSAIQVVADQAAVRIARITARPGEGLAAATREAARPFDLELGPLVRVALIEEQGDQLLVLCLHHILADERALEFLWREIADRYNGRALDIAEPLAQYDDYVNWLRQSGLETRERDLEYWRAHLDPLPEELRLPFERPGQGGRQLTADPTGESAGAAGRGGRLIVRTAALPVRTELKRLADRLGITPFMASAFAFRLLLDRYTHGQQLAFATPVSTRVHPAALEMIGYFLNPLPVYAAIDEQRPVREAVARFSEELTGALAHASVPFDLLAARLSPRRQADRHPIFQVMFVYQEAAPAPSLGEARLEPLTLDLGASKFDLTLFVTERAGRLETGVEYRADRFDDVWMRGLLDHYEQLVEQLPLDLDRRVADVPMLAVAEAARLTGWETGAPLEAGPPALVPHLILEQAQRHAQALAVVCSGVRQDYAALEAAAKGIARALTAGGAQSGDRVAVFLDRSVQMIAAMLGTHLAGAAYVPIDPSYPQARNRSVLADAGVAAVLTTAALESRLPSGPWRTLLVDTIEEGAPTTLPDLSPDLRAYILYTSGSTGRPKGVVITHDNLRLSTLARLQFYRSAPERFLLLPSIAFDSSVAGIFWTLAAGGTLVVPTDDEVRDARRLTRLIEQEQVTTMLCVPSLYAQLLREDVGRLRGLQMVIVAGESCSSRLVDDHFHALPHVRLVNEYGPTEATVWASVYEVQAEDAARPVAIGHPIPGVRVEVRDALGRQVPAGIPGDAWIVGPTVASGYWNRDDLTVECFSNAGPSWSSGRRRYRTGDRMAWTADGRLLFLGRGDEQIKLRGFRIEPGEIEAALLEHPHIDQAAVVARTPGQTPSTDAASAQLVAFVVVKAGGTVDGWRTALVTRLPDHMIPARVVEVPALPRLPNGKIDRRQLLEWPIAVESPPPSAEVADAREQALLSLWEGLLGRYGIGATDNFFELGGHSLLVIQMVAAIARDFEVRLTAADVFQHPTVRELAARIEERGGPRAHTYQQLFPIQTTGRKAPFIMASPDFFTESLAARFRGERPVYGVRGVSLRSEGNRGRWPTLTHLAEDIAGELTRRFSDGPYVIAGYSFGAWLAIETARVLERDGIPVHRLYVIAPMPVDVCRVGPLRVRIDGLRQPLADLGALDVVRHYLRSNHPLTRGPYRRGRQWLFERPWRRALALLGAMRQRRGLSLTPRQLQADVRVERFRLYATHRPAPVHAPTEFFNPVGPASDTAATWRPYFKGPLTVHPIPDPHDEASVGAARELFLGHLRDLGD
jgi:amino acid adenylation domain-containing protein